jgi:hypothetical protein
MFFPCLWSLLTYAKGILLLSLTKKTLQITLPTSPNYVIEESSKTWKFVIKEVQEYDVINLKNWHTTYCKGIFLSGE